MAMTALPGALWLPDPVRVGTGVTQNTIDATGEKYAVIIQVPKTGNIDRVLIRTGNVGTAQTLQVGLQTLDASGDPTGTLYGGSAVGTQASPAANTQYEVTLGTPAAATVGDLIAVVVEFSATVGNVNLASVGALSGPQIPYTDLFTASWAKTAAFPTTAFRYDDTFYYDCFTFPCSAFNAPAVNSGTAGADEYALRFTLPNSFRVVGGWGFLAVAAGADFDMVLYSGTTALLTKSFDGDARAATSAALYHCRFGGTYDLAASTEYRLAIKPTTANNVTIRSITQGSANYWGAWPLGTNGYLSKRIDAGAWSDTTTERPMIGLILDAVDVSAGGGGWPSIGPGLIH